MHLKQIIDTNFRLTNKDPKQKLPSYKCNYCNKVYARQVTRMCSHLLNDCRACPDNVKNRVKIACNKKKRSNTVASLACDDEDSDNGSVSSAASARSVSSAVSNRSRDANRNMASFLDTMSPNEQRQAQYLLATAVYASGTPLSIIDNLHWQIFLSFLRPKFNIPSRHVLSHTLLDKIHADVKSEVDLKIKKASTVGLQCDSWSNIRQEGIVNFIVTTPTPVFYSTLPSAHHSQTAEYYTTQLVKVIDEIGVEKVFGLCTDNASAMKLAWKNIEERYPSIFCYGCVAHSLNLLLKDIGDLESVKSTVNSAKHVVSTIKKVHVLSSTFAEIQNQDSSNTTTTLKNPGQTRFASIVICFQSLLTNKHNLQILAISPRATKYMLPNIKETILNEEFWIKVTKILLLMTPVAEWITKLESDQPRMSLVCAAFADIKRKFEQELSSCLLPFIPEEINAIHTFIEARKDLSIKPIHLAANLLDPGVQGVDLSPAEDQIASQFIFDLAGKFGIPEAELLSELADYKLNTGLFGAEYIKRSANTVTGTDWWRAMCPCSKLGKVAIEILYLLPSSASTERSFSTYGWIHSSKRNRLTTQRAGMITYIAHNIRMIKTETLRGFACASTLVDDENNPVVDDEEVDETDEEPEGLDPEELEPEEMEPEELETQ